MPTVQLHRGYTPNPKAYPAHVSLARFLALVCGRRSGKTKSAAEIFLERVFGMPGGAPGDLMRRLARACADCAGAGCDTCTKPEPGKVALGKGIAPYLVGAVKPRTAQWHKRRPLLHYWCVAETYDLLEEAQRCLFDALPSELLEHFDASKGRLWLHPGILVEFKSGKDPRRLVSAGLNGLWIEEASRLRADAWNGYMRALVSDKEGWVLVTGTPLGEDWVYRDFVIPAQKEAAERARAADEGVPTSAAPLYEFHTWKSVDNVMTPSVVRDVEIARKTLPEEYFRREYEADFHSFIGQIYREFDEAIHCVDRIPEHVRLVRRIGGQDWGFGAPGAALVAGLTDGNLPHFWFLDETYSDSELVEDFWGPAALAMNAKYKFNEWVADPAEPDQLERFRRMKIKVYRHSQKMIDPSKYEEHERSIRDGIRTLRILFKNRRIHIVRPRCPNLIAELKSYRWAQRPANEAIATDSPTAGLAERPARGQKDHAATVMRYIVTWALREGGVRALGLAA